MKQGLTDTDRYTILDMYIHYTVTECNLAAAKAAVFNVRTKTRNGVPLEHKLGVFEATRTAISGVDRIEK